MSVRRSAYFAFGTRHANVLIQFATIAAVARLLTPAELGVFTVGAAFMMLCQILRDFGIGSYLIQAPTLAREQIESAMGIGLLIGAALALVICLLAQPLARFYGQPGVADVLYIMAASFLLMPVQGIGLALLKRNLEFATAFWLETVSSLAWAATAIGLTWYGTGYLSLAWASLAGSILMVVLFLAVRPDTILFRPTLTHWREVASFGSLVSAANVITQIGVLAPAIIMGRTLGFSEVAFYNRGNSVTRMFRDTVEKGARSIALPAFAAQRRAERLDKHSYLHALSLITGVSWPFFCGLALMAYPIVRVLFGDQWDAAVPVVQLLAMANLLNALVVLSTETMIAAGKARYILWRASIVQSARVVLVIACAFHSFEAVAAGQIVASLFAVLVTQFFLNRTIGVTIVDLAVAVLPSLGAAATGMVGPLIVALFYPPAPGLVWPPLLLAVASGIVGWLIGLFALRHQLRDELVLVARKGWAAVAAPYRA